MRSQPQNVVGKNYSNLQQKKDPLSHQMSSFASQGLSVSDTLSQRLSENVGLVCLDKHFDKIETMALNVLTDIMREYALDLASSIK